MEGRGYLKNVGGLSVKEMDGKTVITAPQGAVYLGEFMTSLPAGILNKKQTGCGATSVVLENEENVIICCPTRQLIVSKVSQYPNARCPFKLIGVQKGVTVGDIEQYIRECQGKQPVKIMTTYDSYPRVAALLGDEVIHYKIVVDEYQEILDACVYRDKAIRNLLYELKDKPNVVYLSATPIQYGYKPEELKDMPEFEVEWPDDVRVIPHRIQTDKPFVAASNIILRHKAGYPIEFQGKKVEEYYFFVNSVNAIGAIIKRCGLRPDEVKIICANTPLNKLKLSGFQINNVSDPNKPFTFCTKTVFYGADFYSQSGLIIVVSDGWAKSSMLDISTDIQQIAGRIRNRDNLFRHLILHIYNTGIMCQSRTEFEEDLAWRIGEAQKTIRAYQELPPDLRDVIISKIETDEKEALAYYNRETALVELNELKIAHLRYKFESVDNVYSNGISIREAYEKAGYDVEAGNLLIRELKGGVAMPGGDKFLMHYWLYSNERRRSPHIKTEIAEDIEFRYDIIPLAYDYLGDDFMFKETPKEWQARIWIHYRMPATQTIFKQKLKNIFLIGNRYSLNEVKRLLTRCFSELRIGLRAKATMLAEYFETKAVKIPKDGRRVDGVEIQKCLFLLLSQRRKYRYYWVSDFLYPYL